MSKATDSNHKDGAWKVNWLKKKVIPLLTLLLVTAIIVGIFYLYRQYPDRVAQLEGYGYLGAFLISLILNATVILPAGNFLILFTLGGALPLPFVVGLAGGAGAAIGEITGYIAGRSGRAIVAKQEKIYTRLEHWVKKWGVLTILVFSVVPLIFDLVGIAAGALRLPFWKFLIACWLGRTILYIGIAWLGVPWWEAVLRYLG
ncbi:VTT domain-containing protein [Chloroflexota bacterium]